MATIEDLVLTLSRDTQNRVMIKVTYTAHFMTTEVEGGIWFYESARLHRREGVRDDLRTRPESDPPDIDIFEFDSSTPEMNAGTAVDGRIKRSLERTLGTEDLKKLLKTGREHVYVFVTLQPMGIAGDVKGIELDLVDVGDPGDESVLTKQFQPGEPG